jgi:dGTPase
VRELFAVYMACPQEMRDGFSARSGALTGAPDEANAAARVVADYIAGMTDRFAGGEHERLTGLKVLQ